MPLTQCWQYESALKELIRKNAVIDQPAVCWHVCHVFLFYPALSSWVNFLRLENLIHSFHIMSQNDKILQQQFHEPVKRFYEDGL